MGRDGAGISYGFTKKIEVTCEIHGTIHEGYVHGNLRPDGSLGEVFLSGFGKEGSNAEGWSNFLAITLSMALQSDFDLTGYVERVMEMKFEPHGQTRDQAFPWVPSIPAYIVAWLGARFGDDDLVARVDLARRDWVQ